MSHRIQVADLLTRAGSSRVVRTTIPVELGLPGATVEGDVDVELTLRSLSDGIVARGSARAVAGLSCNRCLVEWTEELVVPVEQVYRSTPEDTDDEMPVEQRQWIDVEPTVHDAVSLALPTTRLCREDCKGLCPTCGTDLNTDPCDGHLGESDSPFAALKQLFET